MRRKMAEKWVRRNGRYFDQNTQGDFRDKFHAGISLRLCPDCMVIANLDISIHLYNTYLLSFFSSFKVDKMYSFYPWGALLAIQFVNHCHCKHTASVSFNSLGAVFNGNLNLHSINLTNIGT